MARLLFSPVPNLDATWYVTDTHDGDAFLGMVVLTTDGWSELIGGRPSVPNAPTMRAAGQILADRADKRFGVALRMY